jgi:hypothetical protein
MLLAALIVAMQAAAATPRPLKAVSVCDILAEDPARFNGKIVSIRGRLEATQEGTWLTGDCKTHLITKGLTWGNLLWVYVDDSDEDIERSWRTITDTLSHLHADTQRDKILVTINGRLETRKSMDDAVYQMPYGLSKVGFGHMGAAPGEIDVISVQDVTIEHPSRNARPKPKN